MKGRSDGTADEEAETDKLGPEEDGKTSVALDEHDSDDSSGSKTEDTPVGTEVVNLIGSLHETKMSSSDEDGARARPSSRY